MTCPNIAKCNEEGAGAAARSAVPPVALYLI